MLPTHLSAWQRPTSGRKQTGEPLTFTSHGYPLRFRITIEASISLDRNVDKRGVDGSCAGLLWDGSI